MRGDCYLPWESIASFFQGGQPGRQHRVGAESNVSRPHLGVGSILRYFEQIEAGRTERPISASPDTRSQAPSSAEHSSTPTSSLSTRLEAEESSRYEVPVLPVRLGSGMRAAVADTLAPNVHQSRDRPRLVFAKVPATGQQYGDAVAAMVEFALAQEYTVWRRVG